MRKLMVGFIFIVLEVYVNVGSLSFGLLPDFVGYLLIYKGISQINVESKHLKTTKTFSLPFVFLSLIIYVLQAIAFVGGGERLMEMNVIIMDIVSGIMMFLITLFICKFFVETKLDNQYNIQAKLNYNTWTITAGLFAFSYALVWNDTIFKLLTLLCFALKIVLLIQFGKTIKLFKQNNKI